MITAMGSIETAVEAMRLGADNSSRNRSIRRDCCRSWRKVARPLRVASREQRLIRLQPTSRVVHAVTER